MSANTFVDNAKVMAKGQITIPKDIREIFGVVSGDRIAFIVEGNAVWIVNSAVYAMQVLQKEMAGEAKRTKRSDFRIVWRLFFPFKDLIAQTNEGDDKDTELEQVRNIKFYRKILTIPPESGSLLVT